MNKTTLLLLALSCLTVTAVAQADRIEDDTHFNAFGASRVCDLAVVELEAKVPALAAHLNWSSKSAEPVTPALDDTP